MEPHWRATEDEHVKHESVREVRRNVMNRKNLVIGLALSCMLILGSVTAYAAPISTGAPSATLLVSGLQGGSGSTIGPDGALYVTEAAAGRVSRVDPKTGAVTKFADGLPKRLIPFGGAMDIAFIDQTAYVLVTLVGSQLGGKDVVGIYRIDGKNTFKVIADIGAFSETHLPSMPVDVPTGVQYAMQPYRGGFLVTDGHHNRVLQVGLDGQRHRVDRVRQYCADRAGSVGQQDLHG